MLREAGHFSLSASFQHLLPLQRALSTGAGRPAVQIVSRSYKQGNRVAPTPRLQPQFPPGAGVRHEPDDGLLQLPGTSAARLPAPPRPTFVWGGGRPVTIVQGIAGRSSLTHSAPVPAHDPQGSAPVRRRCRWSKWSFHAHSPIRVPMGRNGERGRLPPQQCTPASEPISFSSGPPSPSRRASRFPSSQRHSNLVRFGCQVSVAQTFQGLRMAGAPPGK